jgi:hypothetical protein
VDSLALDTGAEKSLLTVPTATAVGGVQPAPPIQIVYAGGDTVRTQDAVFLAGAPAYVVPNLQDNLFSPNHLLSEGYTLYLDGSGGALSSPDQTINLPIHRKKKGYRLWINDLILMPNLDKMYTANAMYKGSFVQSFDQSHPKIDYVPPLKRHPYDMTDHLADYVSSHSSHADLPDSLKSSEGAPTLPKEGDSIYPKTGTALREIKSNFSIVPIAKFHLTGETARLYFHDLHSKQGHISLKNMIPHTFPSPKKFILKIIIANFIVCNYFQF